MKKEEHMCPCDGNHELFAWITLFAVIAGTVFGYIISKDTYVTEVNFSGNETSSFEKCLYICTSLPNQQYTRDCIAKCPEYSLDNKED